MDKNIFRKSSKFFFRPVLAVFEFDVIEVDSNKKEALYKNKLPPPRPKQAPKRPPPPKMRNSPNLNQHFGSMKVTVPSSEILQPTKSAPFAPVRSQGIFSEPLPPKIPPRRTKPYLNPDIPNRTNSLPKY